MYSRAHLAILLDVLRPARRTINAVLHWILELRDCIPHVVEIYGHAITRHLNIIN